MSRPLPQQSLSLGVSVFVLPIEARLPLCLCDPRVNRTHLARPWPIHLWSSTLYEKHLERARFTSREGVESRAHAHRRWLLSAVFQSHKLICAAAFCSLKTQRWSAVNCAIGWTNINPAEQFKKAKAQRPRNARQTWAEVTKLSLTVAFFLI